MLTFDDAEVRGEIAAQTGREVDLALLPFDDLEANLRAQVVQVRSHPWTNGGPVRGLIYDVDTGEVRELD
jgi:carbonic anhydrase